MKVGLSGTFDVDNYGDILFPLVVSNAFNDIEIVPLSPTGEVSSFLDSLAPEAINSNCRDDLSALIIGGGNIIRTTSSYLDRYVDNNIQNTAYSSLWVSLTLANINNQAIIAWNCPGVAETPDEYLNDLIKVALRRTNYISVRDNQSKDILLSICPDVNVEVVPDSVWSISDIFLKKDLELEFEKAVNDDLYHEKIYITFHFNDRYLNDNTFLDLASYVKNICFRFNATPILLSLGNCHDDNSLIEKISSSLDINHKVISKPSSLIQCLSVLAHSKAYFGSSMHGLITASSFGNAAICIADDKIKFDGIQDLFCKKKVYFKSWFDLIDSIDSIDLDDYSIEANRVKKEATILLNKHWSRIRNLIETKKSADKIVFKDLDYWNLRVSNLRIMRLEKKLEEASFLSRRLTRDLGKAHAEISVFKTRLIFLPARILDKIIRKVSNNLLTRKLFELFKKN